MVSVLLCCSATLSVFCYPVHLLFLVSDMCYKSVLLCCFQPERRGPNKGSWNMCNSFLHFLAGIACLLHVSLSHCLNATHGGDSFEYKTSTVELVQNGWSECYSGPYHHPISLYTLIANCPTTDDYYLFIGAYDSNDHSEWAVWGAYGPSDILTTLTNSSSLAYLPKGKWNLYDYPYDVHWYNYPTKSFGFVEGYNDVSGYRHINLSDAGADMSPITEDIYRLSWHMDGDIGGYRAPVNEDWDGTIRNLTQNTSWYKVIYSKHCPEPEDIRHNRPSDWDDVLNKIPQTLDTDTQSFVLIFVAIILLVYGILIAIQLARVHKAPIKKKPTKDLSLMKRYAMPITTLVSLLAAYDIFGDVYFLTTVSYRVFQVEIEIRTHYGFVGCDMNAGYYICEPFQIEPRFVTQKQMNHDATNPLSKNNSQWSSISEYFLGSYPVLMGRSITIYGHSCYDVFHDNTLYTGPHNQLFMDFDECLHHVNGCDDCPATCGFVYLDDQDRCEEWQGGYGCENCNCQTYQKVYSSSHRYYHNGMLHCEEKTAGNVYGWMEYVAYPLLGCILLKEMLKLVFIVSFFLSTKAQKTYLLRISINSPLTGILTVLSPRFSSYIYDIKMDDSSKRTTGLFIDLFFENLPSLFLPIWMELKVNRIENIISLSGSILMVIKNVAMLIKYMSKDYKFTLEANTNASQTNNQQIDAQTTQIEMEQNANKFKLWFYSNVEEAFSTEETDKYYTVLVDNGFDNFKAIKDITHDELNQIGITKLGHRKVVISCSQQI
eukprot:98422_1